MKDKNFVSEDIIRRAYYAIVVEGVSLRKALEDAGIERKRLKQLIEGVLSEEELKKFNNALDEKNKRAKAGTLSNKHKKEKSLKSEKYKKSIEELVKRGIKPEWIEDIYNRCQERRQSKISRDTLAIKLVELLEFFELRNAKIPDTSSGYISTKDVINMIMRNPRMISSDIVRGIIPKCAIITEKNGGNVMIANMKIKSNPGVFRKSEKDIREGK